MVTSYTCRPTLQVRIFIPETKSLASDADGKNNLLPLYIHVHGGGFVVGDAAIDDNFCLKWCKRTGMIVASLNYRKPPLHPFPTAVEDVAAVARAVIDDEALPIDKTKVILAGFSAGGNLALTSALLPELRGKILSVVSFYPIVDWADNPDVKFEKRLDKERKSEPLAKFGWPLDWAYVNAGTDRRTKLLSPCYASKSELPPNICIIAAQYDMFCREARDMIYSLAEESMNPGWEEGFEQGGYKWIYIKE